MELENDFEQKIDDLFQKIKNSDEKEIKRVMKKINRNVDIFFSEPEIQELMLDKTKKYKGYFSRVENDHYMTKENIGNFLDELKAALKNAPKDNSLESATERMLITSMISGVVESFLPDNLQSVNSSVKEYKKDVAAFSKRQQEDFQDKLNDALQNSENETERRKAVKSIIKGKNKAETVAKTAATAAICSPLIALGVATTAVGIAANVALFPITIAAGTIMSADIREYAFLMVGLPTLIGAAPLMISGAAISGAYKSFRKSDEQLKKETDLVMNTTDYLPKEVTEKRLKACKKLSQAFNKDKLRGKKFAIEQAKQMGNGLKDKKMISSSNSKVITHNNQRRKSQEVSARFTS